MATLNEKIGLARALFGTDRTDAPSVNRISGTATADSSDGTVTVQLEDGDIVELGCIGSVRQGQTVTVHVQGTSAQVVAAEGWGDSLQESVDEAVEVANATGQHFWDDTNGAHVTEVTREDWETQPSGFNALWNSLGLLFRKALSNLVAITQSAVTFYDGQGNNAANVTASFGSSGAQVGKTGDSHLVLDSRSLSLIDYGGSTFFEAVDMRDSSGRSTVVQKFVGDGLTASYDISPSASTTTGMTVSVSDGSGGTVTKYTSSIDFSSAPTDGAIITVTYYTASDKMKHYTLGTRASGSTGGEYSVAMGSGNDANGSCSVAEGNGTVAYAPNSHAMGLSTIAANNNQLVIGQFNVPTIHPFIIGNGLENDRFNAFEVGWNGLVTMGGTPFHDMFVYETKTSSAIGSVAANGGTAWVGTNDAPWSVEKTGYKAIAISGYYINGAAALSVYCMRFTDATHVQFAVRNTSSTATQSSAKIEAQILYVKVL